MSRWHFPAVAGLLAIRFALPAPISAQEPVSEPRAEGSHELTRQKMLVELYTNRRVRLGLNVNMRARDTDSIGAFVSSVTPGGPAARAGIKSGDVITRLDGQVVTVRLRNGSYSSAESSAPGIRLLELASRLAPNDTIAVEFRRGKERKTVSLVTGDEPATVWVSPDGNGYAFSVTPGEQPRMLPPGFEPEGEPMLRYDVEVDTAPRPRVRHRVPAPWALAYGVPLVELQLAPMNSELGRYFGTNEGVLVIDAPANSSLGLRGGDVVLAVDGRMPISPAHLLRILRSYEGGEEFKFEIMRMKKRVVVTGSLGPR